MEAEGALAVDGSGGRVPGSWEAERVQFRSSGSGIVTLTQFVRVTADQPSHLSPSCDFPVDRKSFRPPDAKAAHPERSAASAAKRILVVDDSSTLRKILRRWLERRGHVVVEADGGAEALRQTQAAQFDLITLDIDMPDMNGFELCAALRQWEMGNNRSPVPLIFVTSNDTVAGRERGFEVGATDFISKPMQEAEFLVRVDRLLTSNQQLQGLVAIVADDSAVSRKVISLSLTQYGIRVVEAADGAEAYRMLEAEPAKYDLLITDYDMPVMDGKELCRRVRTILGLPWLPIILLSAVSQRESVLELFSAGATDFICKPFTREELAARIGVHVEIRRLNRERSRQIDELERLHELKNNFLSIASHDLRSPLNGIIGAASLLEDAAQISSEDRELAVTCRKSGEWLLEIINDVLDLARIEARQSQAEFAPMGLREIVALACDTVRTIAAPKEIRLLQNFSAADGDMQINGHATDLCRAFSNLLSNAVKFSPRGSVVTLSASRLDPDRVAVTVSDAGIGIPPEKLPLLFDRFSKLSRQGTEGEQSTGLGMAITKEIVERHGGTITAESQVGVGTTFTVTLPLVCS